MTSVDGVCVAELITMILAPALVHGQTSGGGKSFDHDKINVRQVNVFGRFGTEDIFILRDGRENLNSSDKWISGLIGCSQGLFKYACELTQIFRTPGLSSEAWDILRLRLTSDNHPRVEVITAA